jgi:LysR family transcriptional regulator, nod-box dependent transcriptional activator
MPELGRNAPMRFKNLDLNLLAALDTLIRVRNVSRAADEMFITQSAMSNALGRLRDYFDDPLLIQVSRRMELSPLATSMEPLLRDLMVRIEATVVMTPNFSPADSTRRFALVVSDYSLHTIIPHFLREVTRLAPGILIDLKPQQSFPHLLLERGEADLLIAPRVFCSPDHPSTTLLSDPICCVISADSPLAAAPLTVEVLAQAGHVAMQPPAGGESYAARVCREAGLPMRIEVSTFSFASMPDLVRGTDRIALLQRRLAEKMAAAGGFVIADLPLQLPSLEQCVQWHSYRSRDPALTWLLDRLATAAAATAS